MLAEKNLPNSGRCSKIPNEFQNWKGRGGDFMTGGGDAFFKRD